MNEDGIRFGAASRNQTGSSRQSAILRQFLFPLGIYLLAAIVTTWPLALHPRSLLGASVGPGDPYLNLWILGWGMKGILSNPASLFTGAIFDANIFYPARGTLTYSDHLLLQSLILSPLYAVTGDVVLCYNVLLLASLVASACAMHLLVRVVVGSKRGAYLGGMAWGFGSYHFAHLIHLQLQSLYFLPLTFLFLHRVIARGRGRDVALLGVMTALQALSSVYYGVIGGIALVAGGFALAAGVGRWRNVRVLRRLASAAVIATVLILPVAIVYGRVAEREGFGRNLYQASQSDASLSSYLQAPPGNVVYGRSGALRGVNAGPERELFPGFILCALALVGAWRGWRSDAKPTVLAMIVVATVGFVLSFGPDGARGVYAAMHRLVFGFSAIRAPARFAVLVIFGLSILGALGVRYVPRRAAVIVIAAAVIEWLHIPTALAPAPSLHTEVGRWLAQQNGPGAVAILPLGLDVDATPAMVTSLEYRRPILNGYSGQRPDFYRPLAETINAFPSLDALRALHDAHVRFLVSPEPVEPNQPNEPTEPEAPYKLKARFQGATIYELTWTPELEARLAATAAVAPPAPGSIPFKVGEFAEYRVNWGGAGVNLSAGDVTIAVQPPAYRFVVSAKTAPWVARFFEAQDVFTTQADDRLFPLVHERDQHEGSRHLTRAFVFDPQAQVVRTGRTVTDAEGEQGLALPMAPESRDAIAALFYARTLPLTTGDRLRIPVNEAGRNVIVELAVVGDEQISVNGERVDAIRLVPTIQRRIEDRQPVSSTVWLSNDARRVPLAVEVEAPFGHIRVELVSYRP